MFIIRKQFWKHDYILKNQTFIADTLVFHLQLIHDGHILGGSGVYDFDADFEERLRKIFQGR